MELKRKDEERELWWAGAELFRKNANTVLEDDGNERETSGKENNLLTKYTTDYSRWEEWTPDDPVSVLEKKNKEDEKAKRDNEEFERNNPEFCQQFLSDMKERNNAMEKKKDSADSLRVKGNNAFKKKDYAFALTLYRDSLKLSPYSEKTLLNIAQCLIRTQSYDDALEMLKRVLFLNKENAKVIPTYSSS